MFWSYLKLCFYNLSNRFLYQKKVGKFLLNQYYSSYLLDITIKKTIFASCFFGDTRHCWKKRRYAYLVNGNLRNFYKIQGWHSGSHAIAWGCYHICILGFSQDLHLRRGIAVPRFLYMNY